MKYQGVIFDLFETLVHKFVSQKHKAVLRQMAAVLSIPERDFIKLWYATSWGRDTGGFPSLQANIHYISRKLNLDPQASQIETAAELHEDYNRGNLELQEYALETLKELKAENFRLGLISNCSIDVPALWEKTPYPAFFDAVEFSCLTGFKKPDPRIYLLATQQMKVQTQTCMYIGDGSNHELKGAAQVGMFPVLIRHPEHVPVEQIQDPESDARDWHGIRINSLREALKLVK